jgi:hypothetical protein
MPRRKANEASEASNGLAVNRSSGALAHEISNLLRSIGTVLGIAYGDCATPTASIKDLEQAKDSLLAARKAIESQNTV